MKLKVLVLREQFNHMGNHSGYDCLFNHLQQFISMQSVVLNRNEIQIDSALRVVLKKLSMKYAEDFSQDIKSRFNKKLSTEINEQKFPELFKHTPKASKFYGKYALAAELRLIGKRKERKSHIIHISYIENQLGLLVHPEIKRLLDPAKLIGTIHQPIEWWRQKGKMELLNSLDKIIVLSQSDYDSWNLLFPGKIEFIPHGVDEIYFHPSKKPKKSSRCVFAGHWMRDFNTMSQVIEIVTSQNPDIQFDLLIPKKHLPNLGDFIDKISGLENVHFHSDLEDFELLELYQNARLMIMPLLESTANNAILEGMSSGLPIVTSHTSGITSYVSSGCAYIEKKGDATSMAEKIHRLMTDEHLHSVMSENARQNVINSYTWKLIAQKTLDCYQSLHKPKSK